MHMISVAPPPDVEKLAAEARGRDPEHQKNTHGEPVIVYVEAPAPAKGRRKVVKAIIG